MSECRPAADKKESSHQKQNLVPKNVENTILKDETEDMLKFSQVTKISKAIIEYLNQHGLRSIVPRLTRLIAEPGSEGYIDEYRVFHTIFINPKLDPVKVSERIWADQRPLVLTQLASGPLNKVEENGSTQTATRKGAFPFLELPGELRNKVYVYVLKPAVNLKDLSDRTSDWFNFAIFCTSHRIHSESSSAIYKQQISVVVDPIAVACYRIGSHKLPGRSSFNRCWIDGDMSDRRLVQSHRWGYNIYDKSAGLFQLLVEDLKMMKFLEELRLSCKRVKIVCFRIFPDE